MNELIERIKSRQKQIDQRLADLQPEDDSPRSIWIAVLLAVVAVTVLLLL